MFRMNFSGLVFALILLPSLVFAQVTPPKGWSDDYQGKTRVSSNGNATVMVHPWQSLGGQKIDAWLSSLVNTPPKGGKLISAQKIKKESVPGAFSILRSASFGGQKGHAVLYACPGRAGEARLLTLDVKDGGFIDTLKGAAFGEKICKTEIAALGQAPAKPAPGKPAETGASASQSAATTGSGKDPKDLNALIPAGLRPKSASLYTNWVLKGFPAMLTLTMEMVLQFPDGTQLGCSDWVPDGSVSLAKLVRQKDCAIKGNKLSERIYGFKPGHRMNLNFGRLGGFSIDGLEGSAGSLSGGDLMMNTDGQIALKGWNVGRLSSAAATARATSISKSGLVGEYYLNGYTITIVTTQGEVVHGLIGYSPDSNRRISTLFLNGKWYRQKK